MSYKVLVVDDSKLARMAVNKALGALYPSWKSLEATNSEEALSAMETSSPDIALLDFNMPGQNGLELAMAILESHPHMPVAVISANRQQEVVNRTAAIGAFFLAKPLTQDNLAMFLQIAVQHLNATKS